MLRLIRRQAKTASNFVHRPHADILPADLTEVLLAWAFARLSPCVCGYRCSMTRGELGRLAAWHLPCWLVGHPAWWAATSNVAWGSGTQEGTRGPLAREGGLYLDKLFAGTSEFLVTPLLMGPVCLISRAAFKSQSAPVRLSMTIGLL